MLLVVEETETLDTHKGYVYHSSLCLDLDEGELVYLISNAQLSVHGSEFSRVV